MKDAFGVSRSEVSKIVVRTPTRLVRLMSDRLYRPDSAVDRLAAQMKGPDGFVNPVSVAIRRDHNLTYGAAMEAKRLGLKPHTFLPTPKLENGHHRLQLAEREGQKSMLVNYHLRPAREGNSLKQSSSGEWIYEKPYRGIPKDRTREVAGVGVLGITGVGGTAYLAHRRSKVRKKYVYHGTTARAAKHIMRDGFKNNASWGDHDTREAAVYITHFDAAKDYARHGAPNKLGFYRRGRVIRAEMTGEAKPAFDHPMFSGSWQKRTDASNLTPQRAIKIPLTADKRKHNMLVGGAYGAGATAVGGTGYLAYRKSKVKKMMKLPSGVRIRLRAKSSPPIQTEYGWSSPSYGSAASGKVGQFRTISARQNGRTVGELSLAADDNGVMMARVAPELQRQGVGSHMWAGAVKRGWKPKHSDLRTDAGDAWAKKVGGPTPARNPNSPKTMK